ncbi:hypothetical protein RFI_39539 [Reticulomyxa filosa]|uniref:Uncharacterized protein n=1 Tax=Reticulomyxa filosa TaxID=46433 RepID=X6L906_RETFI|nr:hypothetical protein RFI_39539 [Reticulomyxa filosa]|eukprot:ETN97983.1 hypothetical protein RFI_39539 [Reticulomyxa filosa]
MSKEDGKFIEAAEEKETEEEDSGSASAECHNDIEEEQQNALVDKILEEAFGSYLETTTKRRNGSKH